MGTNNKKIFAIPATNNGGMAKIFFLQMIPTIGCKPSPIKTINFRFANLVVFIFIITSIGCQNQIDNQFQKRPIDWEQRLSVINKQIDSLVADTARIDSMIRVLRHNKTKNSHAINQLKNNFATDSTILWGLQGEEHDIYEPGH